jgi:hypothetical protein
MVCSQLGYSQVTTEGAAACLLCKSFVPATKHLRKSTLMWLDHWTADLHITSATDSGALAWPCRALDLRQVATPLLLTSLQERSP